MSIPATEQPSPAGIKSTTTSTHDTTSLPGVTGAEEFGHAYSIQIRSYREDRRALADVNQLRKLGYQAFIIKLDIPGKGIWHRVMFGKFQAEADAHAMLKKVKTTKGFSDARIIRVKEGKG